MRAPIDSVSRYALALGDDALILAQRCAQWVTRAPQLEEDVALANVGLDLLGQARMLLSYAGRAEGAGRDEDDLAYFRDPDDFRNVILVELENGDFALSMARLLGFAAYARPLWASLASSTDPDLAAVAGKAVKEVAYHFDHAAGWVRRLGDGTELSQARMQQGLDRVWGHLPELFDEGWLDPALVESGVAVAPRALEAEVRAALEEVVVEATLARPEVAPAVGGGRWGRHTEALGSLLEELQHLTRTHPGGDVVTTDLQARAAEVAAEVVDPEIPVLSIEDLGVLRTVRVEEDETVVVEITPTYSGCPALDAITADLRTRLEAAGFPRVLVRPVLAPAWTTDWITPRGRAALEAYGIAPPSPTRRPTGGPVALTLTLRCPQCGSADTEELSRFSATACKALWRCRSCREPFEHFKAL